MCLAHSSRVSPPGVDMRNDLRHWACNRSPSLARFGLGSQETQGRVARKRESRICDRQLQASSSASDAMQGFSFSKLFSR